MHPYDQAAFERFMASQPNSKVASAHVSALPNSLSDLTGDKLYHETGTHFSHPDSVKTYAHRKYLPETWEDGNERSLIIIKDEKGYKPEKLSIGDNNKTFYDYSGIEWPRDTLAAMWHTHPKLPKELRGFSGTDVIGYQQKGIPGSLSWEGGLAELDIKPINDNLRFANSEAAPILQKMTKLQENNLDDSPEFNKLETLLKNIYIKHGINYEDYLSKSSEINNEKNKSSFRSLINNYD
jgi:hypothetical protein